MTGGTLKANASSAFAGDTVTLTATPSSGYVYVGATMSYTENGSNVSKALAYNELTFTMPESDVTITPKWSKPTSTSGEIKYDLAADMYEGAYTIIPYTISYNPATNQSTVSFSTLTCRIWCGSWQTTTLSLSIIVKATDSGKSASSSLSTSEIGNADNDGYHLQYPSVSPASVTVKHSSTAGSKSVTISSSSTMTTHTGWTGYGSGSKTHTVGTYSG